jgi:3-hydroxyacyl-[acyl-carrier-protein] dehydratase
MSQTIDIRGVLERLPHRYPFLLVDRVLECVPGSSIVTLKNVTMNEPFFQGHFPNYPVMPGVLITEALAQTAALLAALTSEAQIEGGAKAGDNTVYFLAGVDNARFKRPVVPGDTLTMYAELARHKLSLWTFATKAEVDGKVVSSADIMCTVRDV